MHSLSYATSDRYDCGALRLRAIYTFALSPACVWSVKVCTHSALEKSQIFTVVSPLEVTNLEPLKKKMSSLQRLFYTSHIEVHIFKLQKELCLHSIINSNMQ